MFTASFTSPANDVQTALLRHVHVIVRLFMFSKHCLLNVAYSGTHRFTWRVTLRIITDVCGITVDKCDEKPSEFYVLIWIHACPINFPLVESCKWQGVHISVVTTERTLWPLYLSLPTPTYPTTAAGLHAFNFLFDTFTFIWNQNNLILFPGSIHYTHPQIVPNFHFSSSILSLFSFTTIIRYIMPDVKVYVAGEKNKTIISTFLFIVHKRECCMSTL